MLLGSRPAPIVENLDGIPGNELAGSIKIFNQNNQGSAGTVPIGTGGNPVSKRER
jgi:hypothetical protein